MKLFIFFFFVASLQLSAKSYSQNVNLEATNITLKKAFREIGKQTGYSFFINHKLLKDADPVSFSLKDATINEALRACLKDQPFTYAIIGKTVFLRARKDVDETATKLLLSEIQIEGVITDASTGKPLAGVSVMIKGSKEGTTTDATGHFKLTVQEDAVLQVSSIGYENEEVKVNGRTFIQIELKPTVTGLNQIVVVGYGTQKKVDLTGSVTSIDPSEILDIPVPNITQSIMGRSPGMFIKNTNAQPGDNDNVVFNIRGFGDPLIIIDGMPASTEVFNQLNPNDIAGFSVLKDAAAAAVYGARAGNGVILVTTKRGQEGKAQITYNGNYSLQYFATIPDWVNAETYARMQNLARYNSGEEPIWSDEEIQKFKDGSDPKYPDNDWENIVLRKYAPQTNHSITVRGGSEKIKYFVSGGYFYQEDLTRANDTKNKRYNLRSNLDMAVTDKLDLSMNFHVLSEKFLGPLHQLERQRRRSTEFDVTSIDGVMTALFRARPYWFAHYPDPTKIVGVGNNPLGKSTLENNGYRKNDAVTGDIKFSAAYELPFGFNAKANFQFFRSYDHYTEKRDKVPVYDYNWDTDVYTALGYTNSERRLDERRSSENRFNQQYFLTWNKKIKDHNIDAMAVYEILSSNEDWMEASRRRYEFDIDYLFAGPLLDLTNNGSGSRDGRKSWITRVNYDYKGKYLFQFSGRYDASPRFPKETRWGFFPSVSAGWRISEEAFMDKVPIISNLKIRASHGLLGYDNTGQFQYLSTFGVGGQYIFDGSTNELTTGISPDALPNPYITWEKMRTSNIGLDFGLWNNRLTGSFDYFYRLRSDVLGQRIKSIPNVVGADLAEENYAKFSNRGWELVLDYRQRLGDFQINIGGNISWNREKTELVDQEPFASQEARRTENEIGEWTDRQWGLMSDGLFSSKEEIEGWADQDGRNNATVLPGDVKLIDYNGDGRITGADEVLIGRGDFPRFTYGVHLGVSWKGLDLNTLWQGAGLYDFNLLRAGDLAIPFKSFNTPIEAWTHDIYIPENPWIPANEDINARWPRYRSHQGYRGHPNYDFSDFWFIRGHYIRLKNISLGYSLPQKVTGKLGINSCRFYVSGYNVLTFFPLDFLDPEADTHTKRTMGSYYPPVGTYNFGLTIGL